MTILDSILKRAQGEMHKPSPAMRKAIATAHTAAYYAALKERTGVMSKGLSKRERAELKERVGEQLKYYERFAAAAGDMSEGATTARAQLYAGAIKTTYYATRWGGWDIPDNLIPGNQQCLGNCLCRITVTDNGDGTGTLTRTMGGTEHHCTECPALVGDHEITRRAS
jgi:hypothetical protein